MRNGLILGLFMALALSLQAQYFGRNKPNYENFNFRVYQTPNFEIYHYFQDENVLRDLANQSEHWYHMHQAVLKDTIKEKNPLIFYHDHPDFQQTNTIGSMIGVGTGGVTEAFKNRVILPLAMSNQQTHHVLGHEMVHAFQYNMVINGDSTSLNNLANLPLWMVEGLAEYMSIGSIDAHTAMWMRDAVLNDDVPKLKELNNPKYFPYRYGHAFWAFVTGLKGDDIIEPLFIATARFGFDQACRQVLDMSQDNLSELWVQALKRHFGDQLGGEKKERFVGKELINKKTAGEINISPMISPNGRYVIFLSEKDLFSIDLFLADARTGELIRKVASSTKSSHIDDFSYIESAGTWSPNSQEFAFVAVSKGDNILIIKDALSGKTVKEVTLKGVPAFSNPAWSPDGKTIVVTGLVEGKIDLYGLDVRTEKVTRLTDNRYSEMHPFWSEDGKYIVFSTDQLSFERGRVNGKWSFNLARLNVDTREIEHFDIFPGADNLNPVIDTAGNVLFLSNRDGFRNLYRYEPASGKVFQLTDFLTGISGITHYAPALSIERNRNRVVFTHYLDNNYTIYRARPEDLLNKEVDPKDVDFAAAQLPRLNKRAPNLVDMQLAELDQREEVSADKFLERNYKAKFKLDYIAGSTGIGVGTSNTFGTTTGLAGGVDLIFSDMLGNNQLYSTLALNGEIQDFGGAVAYINRKNRINWGGQISHIPYRSIQVAGRFIDSLIIDDTNYGLYDHWVLDITRLFEDKAAIFAQYPFSTTMRVEAGASFANYSYRVDRIDNYYNAFGGLVYQDRNKVDLPSGLAFRLGTVEAAIVGDNSFFGLTAPLQGQRFRLGVEQYFGEFNFLAPTADYRIYRFFKPIGLAFRALHYGRYGGNSERLFPLYLGSPWYVRGYNSNIAQEILLQNGRSIDELLGSKMFVSNFEVRIPFSGPERLALIKSSFFFTDLNFFVDGGVAWFDFDQFNDSQDSKYWQARPVFSTGASLRINLFGAMILEPFYAFPIMKETKGVFGLNIVPGW
jgi:Tol biopolymer transport system component